MCIEDLKKKSKEGPVSQNCPEKRETLFLGIIFHGGIRIKSVRHLSKRKTVLKGQDNLIDLKEDNDERSKWDKMCLLLRFPSNKVNICAG